MWVSHRGSWEGPGLREGKAGLEETSEWEAFPGTPEQALRVPCVESPNTSCLLSSQTARFSCLGRESVVDTNPACRMSEF